MSREVYIVTHGYRPDAEDSADRMTRELNARGIATRRSGPIGDAEIVAVLGGDGTILRAAELTRGTAVPIVGINYGHVGFLAEADPSSLPRVVDQIVEKEWTLDRRMVLDVEVTLPDGQVHSSWTLNEAALEKVGGGTVEVSVGVDGRGLSSFTCDAVLIATPTGSTAYAFSAGGPVVWPSVDAILFVPVAAHALFTRPLVVGPNSNVEVHVINGTGRLFCDGRRELPVPPGTAVRVSRSDDPVYLARLNDTPFSGRLVKKFDLPVGGWRTGGADQ